MSNITVMRPIWCCRPPDDPTARPSARRDTTGCSAFELYRNTESNNEKVSYLFYCYSAIFSPAQHLARHSSTSKCYTTIKQEIEEEEEENTEERHAEEAEEDAEEPRAEETEEDVEDHHAKERREDEVNQRRPEEAEEDTEEPRSPPPPPRSPPLLCHCLHLNLLRGLLG